MISTGMQGRKQTMENPLRYEENDVPPKTSIQWMQQGRELLNKNKPEEALYAFEEALRLDLNNIKAYDGKGVTLGKLKRYEEAIQAYDQALHLNPNDEKSYYDKGLALRELGRYEEAIQAFDQVLRLNTDHGN